MTNPTCPDCGWELSKRELDDSFGYTCFFCGSDFDDDESDLPSDDDYAPDLPPDMLYGDE